MNLKEKIGKRIKILREERKLKQEDLAWQSNLDRSYMNHVENGKRNITISSLEKIVIDGLKMTLSDFFNHEIFNDSDSNN
ncbi:MAG TPA: transcriptional regulator [Prolixibacteraceae bacterium]|nr:transcriptional regulator [Prolixibacteraceae bacterium]